MGSLLILFQSSFLRCPFDPRPLTSLHSSIRFMVDGPILVSEIPFCHHFCCFLRILRIGFMFAGNLVVWIWELVLWFLLSTSLPISELSPVEFSSKTASMSPPSICAVPNSAVTLNATACSTAVSSHTLALISQPNSGSEEDPHHVVDERKQKRMLSNRESARRSRMRKQQHLDELRAQAAQLRAENNHILIKFNVASHHYLQLLEENSVLRSHAMHLSLKLRSLNTAMQWVGGSSGLGLDAGFLDSNFLNTMDMKPWNSPSIPQALPATEIFQ